MLKIHRSFLYFISFAVGMVMIGAGGVAVNAGSLRLIGYQTPASGSGTLPGKAAIVPARSGRNAVPAKPSITIQSNRSWIGEGRSVVVTATVKTSTRQKQIADLRLWPYVNGRQWGAAEKTNRRGWAKFIIPLPDVGISRIQVAEKGSAGLAFPVGRPLSKQAQTSNIVSVRVTARKFTVPSHRHHLVGMDYEPWFTPLNATWNTAEAIPLLGKYSSFNPLVIRQHALWLDQMGINYILIDWSNNLWGKTRFNQRPPNARQLISATTLLLKTYAQMRRQGIATPQVTLLLGLVNGPPTTTTALNGELAWIYRKYIRNPHFAGLWLDDHRKPLIVIFNGGGPAFLAGKLAAGEPPINTHNFTVRWMASQLQATPGMAHAGYWSWMDGSIRPVPTYHGGQCEALTITPAFFAAGGWLAPPARARDNGFTYVREFKAALRYRPRFLNICQWNEFAGQSIGHGYGPRHNNYVDCYDKHLNNDIEPTSLTACAYRGCGGWGFYYLNLTRACINVYHQKVPQTTVLAIGSPDRNAAVSGKTLRVRWACIGKPPRSFTVLIDGRQIGGVINRAARAYNVRLKGLKPGRHELTLRANGAMSLFRLSYTHQARRMHHAIPAAAHVTFFIR